MGELTRVVETLRRESLELEECKAELAMWRTTQRHVEASGRTEMGVGLGETALPVPVLPLAGALPPADGLLVPTVTTQLATGHVSSGPSNRAEAGRTLPQTMVSWVPPTASAGPGALPGAFSEPMAVPTTTTSGFWLSTAETWSQLAVSAARDPGATSLTESIPGLLTATGPARLPAATARVGAASANQAAAETKAPSPILAIPGTERIPLSARGPGVSATASATLSRGDSTLAMPQFRQLPRIPPFTGRGA